MSTAEHDTALRATLAGLRDLLRPRVRLQLADDERLDGRTALITGGNRGLGFGIAELLARRGARLILACRSGGDEAAARLRAITGNQAIEALQVDVSERASVAALVATLAERGEALDRVILNAAVVASESRTTSAGLDVMFHVNFLAVVDLVEQLLARRLMGPATRAPARIVVVSSEAHRSGKPALDRFREPERYGTSGSLAQYG
ncbi:MAG TPA: SDR family NAD(P)-dependent oxidoreductase, partial [Enhygromyxa sp.]|nr:SDR family NAD(P)-dependent oxidoreductase [Enhygromyxa sp.]